MHKAVTTALVFSMLSFSSHLLADNDLNQYKEETEALWRNGTGSQDGAYSAIAVSMLGWGLGLGTAIAIIASVLHQSTASSSHNNSHTCH